MLGKGVDEKDTKWRKEVWRGNWSKGWRERADRFGLPAQRQNASGREEYRPKALNLNNAFLRACRSLEFANYFVPRLSDSPSLVNILHRVWKSVGAPARCQGHLENFSEVEDLCEATARRAWSELVGHCC